MNAFPLVVARVYEEAGRLANNYRLVEDLRSALGSGQHAYSMVPPLVEEVLDEDAWMDRAAGYSPRMTYNPDEFRKFVEDPPPKGLGSTEGEVRKYLGDSTNPLRNRFETLWARGPGGPNNHHEDQPRDDNGQFVAEHNMNGKASTVNPNMIRVDGETPQSTTDGPHDSDVPRAGIDLVLPIFPESPSPPKRDRSREPQAGTSIGYTVRRLQREARDTENPEQARLSAEILGRLERGEISANRAAVLAGHRPESITVPDHPEKAARVLLIHFRGERLAALVEALCDGLMVGGGSP